MKIGIITVRGQQYHPNRRLAEAAGEYGHEVILIHPYRNWPAIENGHFELVNLPKGAFPDAVLPRQGSTLGDSCLLLIEHFSKMGVPVINSSKAIRVAKNQFLSLQKLAAAGIQIPETVFINAPDGFAPAISQLGGFPVVAKQVSSRQGTGVMLLKTDEDVNGCIDKHLDNCNGMIVQKFIPLRGRRELRVLVIGDKIVGAMEMIPKNGDFRGNYHLSGISRPAKLTPLIQKMAIQSAAAADLEIVGVDLITNAKGETVVIEINYSPGFKGMESATGLNIAGQMIDYIVQRHA